MEAYQQVNAPEQIGEASRADEFTRAAISRSSGRKGGITFEPGPNWDPSANRGKGAHLSPKQKEKQRRKALRQEQLDIFDIVLEFLQVEGYAETLEEAEWMMANLIDEEAVAIILGEDQLDEADKENFELWVESLVEEGYDLSEYTWDEMYDIYEAEGSYGQTPKARQAMGKLAIARREKPASEYSQKGEKTKKVKSIEKHTRRIDNGPDVGNRGKKSTPSSRMYSGKRGKLDQDSRDYARDSAVEYTAGGNKPGPGTVTKNPKKLRKQKAMGEISKESFEAWLDEAMTNYEKNRKRAAQRAAARNAARDQGKTGAVPGVGYVTPRRERETWTDESGKTRHAKGL